MNELTFNKDGKLISNSDRYLRINPKDTDDVAK